MHPDNEIEIEFDDGKRFLIEPAKWPGTSDALGSLRKAFGSRSVVTIGPVTIDMAKVRYVLVREPAPTP